MYFCVSFSVRIHDRKKIIETPDIAGKLREIAHGSLQPRRIDNRLLNLQVVPLDLDEAFARQNPTEKIDLEIGLQGDYPVAMKSLDPSQREVLSRLAAVILPETLTMMSATDGDLGQNLVDDVLRSRPDLIAPLLEVLGSVGAVSAPTFLARMAEAEPQRFSVLMQVVAGAYYLNPRVRSAIGYTGQRAIPISDLARPSPAFTQHSSRDRIRYRSP